MRRSKDEERADREEHEGNGFVAISGDPAASGDTVSLAPVEFEA